MAFAPHILEITESDDELRSILAHPTTDLPPLLPALAHATGDTSLLASELFLDPADFMAEQGGWNPQQQERCRELALGALIALRDRGDQPVEPPTDTQLQALLEWTTGTTLNSSYVSMLGEELAPDNTDPRAPSWHKDRIAPRRDFNVVIIGAGMSGILGAHRLKQAGIDVLVLDKNAGIGGTLLENTYPGCRVDVANHVYAYSFMQRHDWPQFHSSQEVLLKYFNDCADHFGIREQIRFNTEVGSVVWDDEDHMWTLEIVTPNGEETLRAAAVISAVGQLNRPSYPDIEGRESFAGPSFHSAE
ncbi:MAG: flavin-containing monooxygenase, partial [Acidimicrobiales bacterium]